MIDRIWYGPEREGFEKGKMTAFIEAELLTGEDIALILQSVKDLGISRLYFGANERDLLDAPENFIRRFWGFEVFVETSLGNLLTALRLAGSGERIILRQWVELPTEAMLKIQFKLRNQNDILVYKDWAHTSTKEIKEGIYTECDTLLYERK